jgi:mxaD protein
MVTVRVSDEIDAPAAKVWACFADFGDSSAWGPPGTHSTLEGSGVGAVRTFFVGDQPQAREQLVAFDAAEKTLSYTIVESPVPVRDYRATIAVRDAGPGRATIEWSSTFEPSGMPADDARGLMETIYAGFIATLKQSLAGR